MNGSVKVLMFNEKRILIMNNDKTKELSLIIDKTLHDNGVLPTVSNHAVRQSDVYEYMSEVLKVKSVVFNKLFSEFLGIQDIDKKDLFVFGAKMPELAEAALKDEKSRNKLNKILNEFQFESKLK